MDLTEEHLLGIDIGGTKTSIGIFEKGREYREILRIPTETPELTLKKLRSAVEGTRKIGAIGIACGGPLDTKEGYILNPPNLPRWHNFNVVEFVSKSFDSKTFLMNDANANALAEWEFGAGQQVANMVFLTAGTGMGAGIICNNQLITGDTDDAGEVGHIRLQKKGPRGYGKHGSFEGFCSGGGIPNLVQYLPKTIKPKDWKKWKQDHPDVISITDAADEGDPVAREVFRLSGYRLGEALAIIVDILNPSRIVLGTLFLHCYKYLAPAMDQALASEALTRNKENCTIVQSSLGKHIGGYGSICAALYGLGKI